MVKCYACGAEQCFLHQVPWHEGLTCNQYRLKVTNETENLTFKWLNDQTKACPGPGCVRRVGFDSSISSLNSNNIMQTLDSKAGRVWSYDLQAAWRVWFRIVSTLPFGIRLDFTERLLPTTVVGCAWHLGNLLEITTIPIITTAASTIAANQTNDLHPPRFCWLYTILRLSQFLIWRLRHIEVVPLHVSSPITVRVFRLIAQQTRQHLKMHLFKSPTQLLYWEKY